MTDELVQRVADELGIRRTLARLSRAQDTVDREAYKTCFTERVLLAATVVIPDWEPREVSVDELADRYFAEMDKYIFGQHFVTNHIIDVDGDEATCTADLWCVSALRDGADPRVTGLGGRYDLKLRRVGGEWRICERSIFENYSFDAGELLRHGA
ncbi:nuclear transport factor 2 family protein [Amycolatopsis pithecellobii]|uniref:SnoaL-like domain-containing protein n=1 Tax=Amycolatopsis pithecellobii TaxID=664692 RepID=A0A6N7Z5C5_9PSEU|nr:nuclear transport factor 2 family protein [Amycolatopsis pithecellobii]MTD54636.1 hypothetical protein [Amycolatopsis pithecellobii]